VAALAGNIFYRYFNLRISPNIDLIVNFFYSMIKNIVQGKFKFFEMKEKKANLIAFSNFNQA
jgi:hypothetical protein